MASEMLGGWFGSSVVGKLINLAFDYAEGQVIWQTGIKAELKRLQFLQPRVEAVVAASSRVHDLKNRNKALYNWLQQLQDAIDDADDALDELEYLRIKEQLRKEEDGDTEAELNQVSYTVSSIQQSLIRFGNRALERDPVLLKLKGALENLDRVFAGVAELNQLVDWVKQEQLQQQIELTLNRETGSYPTSDLIRYEEDVTHVIQWLRSSDPEGGRGSGLYGNISLLSIVGIGGMGKTTLVQHVYHKDDIIKQELHFDCKMWACISNVFDVKRVISDMLESLTGVEKPNLGSLDAHQRRLNAGVSSKKFLLVLDDAWDEPNSEEIVYMKKWEALLAPLCGGKKGSKILLTTRMESVARLVARTMNRKQEMIWKLKGLKAGEIELLLNWYAFAGIDNINDYPKLNFIANQIAKKLYGSPLRAKVIGGALRSNMDERHWMYILSSSSSIWDAEPLQKGIMSILRLSYDFLPTQLQRCFAFCSIFKHDHLFDKVELVRMWVALGFIQQSDRSSRTIDDVGESYFDFLFQRSFFEKHPREHGYVMHDVLHDLAMLVADGKCLSIIGDGLDSFSILDNVRHLSIST